MTWFVFIGGTLLYFVLGAALDAALPGLDLLGFNVRGLVFSTLCLIAALWAAVKLRLFD
jgi:hypothetical protein